MEEANSRSKTVRLRFRDRSEVSLFIKYLIFAFNVIIWLIGAALTAVGIWALTQKDTNISQLGASFISPVLLILFAGIIIFVTGFFGCIGALRENTCLLVMYMIVVGAIFLLLVAGAVILFAFSDWIKSEVVESPLRNTIAQYRDDPDLQNLIDWIQADWLHCCGLNDYNDWESNIYFNCSSPGVESCGVPFSCCQPNSDPEFFLLNTQCGFGIRRQDPLDVEASKVIYTKGCLEQGSVWFQQYMIPIAGVIVGSAVVLLLGLCCAWNLVCDIRRQKARWRRQH